MFTDPKRGSYKRAKGSVYGSQGQRTRPSQQFSSFDLQGAERVKAISRASVRGYSAASAAQ
eukprot:8828999-Pyramimonas_sp.AAC.1